MTFFAFLCSVYQRIPSVPSVLGPAIVVGKSEALPGGNEGASFRGGLNWLPSWHYSSVHFSGASAVSFLYVVVPGILWNKCILGVFGPWHLE
jgi:hypothetical protein